MTWEAKPSLLARGVELMQRFCAANDLQVPQVVTYEPSAWRYPHTCAYYRPVEIHICVARCAAIGYAGMSWSFPGHSVDRTPYGVIAHELGHHADMESSTRKDRYRGDFSIQMRKLSGEQPLTSYCPDDGEWFAEMFRLFVTNPDLLSKLRPATHALMLRHFKPVHEDTWRERLAVAPERTIASIEKKLEVKPARARKAAAPSLFDSHPPR